MFQVTRLLHLFQIRPAAAQNLLKMSSQHSHNLRRIIINTAAAPGAIGPYNQAVMVDRTLYISGCIGFIPKTMEIVAGGAAAEANQALINMGAILKSVGCTHNNVVKTTVLLDDIKDFADVNEVYKKFFSSHEPARAAYQAAALPKGAKVEIEAIAVVGQIQDEEHVE
jgi:2-iminobutanoate/2-iminopropanoate deaminase